MRQLLQCACVLICFGCGNNNGGDDTTEGGPLGDAGADVVSSDVIGGDDGPAPPTPTGRLFVSINKPAADAGLAGTILVWDGIDTLTTATAPSFALANATGSTEGLAIVGTTLVTSPFAGGFALFTGAAILTTSSAPTKWGTGFTSWDSFTYSPAIDALWATHALARTARFDQASTLSSTSTSAMDFVYGGYASSFAYDPIGDRAFVGQQYDTTISAWNGAKSLTGSTTTVPASFTLSTTFPATDMSIGHDRLYALGTSGVGVWPNISTVTAKTAPAFTITAATMNGAVATPSDLLIVCQLSGVLIWKNASTLTADKAPDFTLTTPGIARKAVLAPTTDRLYVIDGTDVSIWSSASTNPTLVAHLTTPTLAQDIAVLE